MKIDLHSSSNFTPASLRAHTKIRLPRVPSRGGRTDATQHPAVILGGDGGRIKGGCVLDCKEKPVRQMCRLYLSMVDKMNVRLPKFGDAAKVREEV